jgi:hypothetical protein
MAAQPNPLNTELHIYEEHRSSWAREHAGEFVVIHADAPARFFNSYEAAFTAAFREYGYNSVFLIKQVLLHEPVYSIS